MRAAVLASKPQAVHQLVLMVVRSRSIAMLISGSRRSDFGSQNAIDGGPPNAEPTRDLDRAHAICLERPDLSRTCARCGLATLIFPFGFRASDAFALPFKHEFAFEAAYGGDQRIN
jgi:hypothetical protein